MIEIKGDVGSAITAGYGSVLNIYMPANIDDKTLALNHAVHHLLKACEDHQCQAAIERISKLLFGVKRFKLLSLEQLATLQAIADEFKPTYRQCVPTLEELNLLMMMLKVEEPCC